MYLVLAIFWLVVGLILQVFWTTLQPLARIPADRTTMGVICFILSLYCFVRWRMMLALRRARHVDEELHWRRRDAVRRIDPTFDFSDPQSDDEKKFKNQHEDGA